MMGESEKYIDQLVNESFGYDLTESILFEDIPYPLVEFIIKNSKERKSDYNKWKKTIGDKKKNGIIGRIKQTAKNIEDGSKDFKDATAKMNKQSSNIETKNKIMYAAGAVAAAAIIKYAYDKYREYKYGECAKLSGQDRKHCQIKAIEKTISELRDRQSMCSKSKDPTKCKLKVLTKIKKLIKQREDLLKSL